MSKISKTNVDRMVWVDIETSGLSLSFCRTLELGVAITTPKGDVIDMNNWVIKPDSLAPVLEHMRPDVREMHTKNLLIDEIGMDHALTMLEAESEAIGFLQQHRVEARHYPMAGSSVHFDRSFLKIDMPASHPFVSLLDYEHRLSQTTNLRMMSAIECCLTSKTASSCTSSISAIS